MDYFSESDRPLRRFARFQIETQVAVLRQGRFQVEKSVELSEGGMLVKASGPLLVGEQVEVNFFLLHLGFVTAAAEVIYEIPTAGGPLVGMKFVALSSRAQDAIRGLKTI